ncbi:dentin sialophosphoprotein-like, partial [Frankliniella occidentalis]|uniref:Dentin sialophosphoprotein-like n=1 Tax=Frankliniella occidentalis TaxID=133901 RepID=A0A9C6XVY6_FRAOC
LPSPFSGKHGAVTSIPVPATSTPLRRNPPDKARHLLPPGALSQPPGSPLASASSSRSTSPSSAAHSFIPKPGNRSSLTEKHINGNGRQHSQIRAPAVASPYSANAGPQSNNGKNSSMLDKFKLFNNKDKTDKIKSSSSGTTGVSKRTSSSSGFSSARSERSDSSTSLCSDARPSSGPREGHNGHLPAPGHHAPGHHGHADSPSPKPSLSLRSKISRGAGKDAKQSSPKSSRKDDAKQHKQGGIAVSGSVCGVVSAIPAGSRASTGSGLVPPRVGTPSSTPTSRLSASTPEHDRPAVVSRAGSAGAATPERERAPSMRDSGVSDLRSGSNSTASSPPANGPGSGPGSMYNGSLSPLPTTTPGIPHPGHHLNAFNGGHNGHGLPNGGHNVVHIGHNGSHNVSHNGHNGFHNVIQNDHQNGLQNGFPNGHQQGVQHNGSGTLPQPGVGTGIPKPTAAVKGTTKPPRPDSNGSLISLKAEKQDLVIKPKQSPTKEEAVVNGYPTSNNPADLVSSVNSINANLSVALVSPMQQNDLNESKTDSSNSTGQSNSSDGSIVFRPNESDTSSMIIGKDANGHHSAEGSFDDDDSTMNVKPMQPLLQGYHRSARGLGSGLGPAKHNKYSGYPNKMEQKRASNGDVEGCDPSSGYVSDGDVLRRRSNQCGLPDVSDGYMSDAGVYAAHQQQQQQQQQRGYEGHGNPHSG